MTNELRNFGHCRSESSTPCKSFSPVIIWPTSLGLLPVKHHSLLAIPIRFVYKMNMFTIPHQPIVLAVRIDQASADVKRRSC
jgi:hypothetical protein